MLTTRHAVEEDATGNLATIIPFPGAGDTSGLSEPLYSVFRKLRDSVDWVSEEASGSPALYHLLARGMADSRVEPDVWAIRLDSRALSLTNLGFFGSLEDAAYAAHAAVLEAGPDPAWSLMFQDPAPEPVDIDWLSSLGEIRAVEDPSFVLPWAVEDDSDE